MTDWTKNNVIGTMRHAVACPFVQSDGLQACDCSPVDDAKAMRAADVLRVFAPLSTDEADAIRPYLS